MSAVLEDAKEIKVNQWNTLNTAASPNKLPEGHSPNNNNVWMDEKPGSVVTSNGYIKLGEIPSGNPPTFGIEFFKSSDGTSKFVVSDGQTVWWTTDYTTFHSIKTGLSEFFQLRGMVIRDKLWLTNGSDPVMTWDGTTLTVMDGSGGTPNVPHGKYIHYHDERVWMYGIEGDLSSVRFTALADATGTEVAPDSVDAWAATDNQVQISEGDADIGTGLWLYRGFLYCSKQFSIWRIEGADEYDYTRVKTRASTGTRFQESVQIKDNLVHFIGVDGMYVFDGEDATRISDIIDPSSPDTGVFAFRNLQQPLLNNQFWVVSETVDFAAGTVPHNLTDIGDQLVLAPTDDTQADFLLGNTFTQVTALYNPGSVQLDQSTAGFSNNNLVAGQSVLALSPNISQIGDPAALTDGNFDASFGFSGSGTGQVIVSLASLIAGVPFAPVTTLVLKGLIPGLSSGGITFKDADGNALIPTSVTSPAVADGVGIHFPSLTVAQDYTVTFPVFTTISISMYITSFSGLVMTELQVFSTAYLTTGRYISRTLDYGARPESFGYFHAVHTLNGGTAVYHTQSSNDGVTWEAEIIAQQDAPIISTGARYLRWIVDLTAGSSGLTTPAVDKVYFGGAYTSEPHDTGGNIFQWAAFQMTQNKGGQTITAYFRTATTEAGLTGDFWHEIIPGAVPDAAILNQFIQIHIIFSILDAVQLPSVQSFTVNWIVGSGAGVNTNQNVASIIWLNRYWLTAATLGAQANDINIILGKSTFKSPWHKKNYNILMFCRYQNILIAGSSLDGSLYRMEYGYSKNGSALDSYYETADFSQDGFFIKGLELLVTCDRMGPYNLYVGWSIDGGRTWTERTVGLTRATGQSLSFTKRLNISFMADSVRFRVRTNQADQPFSVDDLQAFYRLSPQRGSLN